MSRSEGESALSFAANMGIQELTTDRINSY